jgi:hypothetical protein
LTVPDARVFEFAVTPSEPGAYVFGMALDPDIGPNPADDASGYDATRGLVYAHDAGAAVGFLLRAGRANTAHSVQQYGVARPSPRLPADVWRAQRAGGVFLLTGARDVQLVVSATARNGPAQYTFAVIRAGTLADLQTKADAVIAALASSP